MLTALAGAIVPIVLKEGLTEENIEKAAEFLVASGKKLGSKAAEYLEKHKRRREKLPESMEDDGIPVEVQEEMQASLKECLEKQARDVYMGGVAFFCERPMDDDVQENLAEILANISEDTDCLAWEDESDATYQEVVDDFMRENYGDGCFLSEEKDFCIGKDFLYLNLAFDEGDEYRLCDNQAVRLLANALNHLLRDRYLTKFTIY